MSYFLKAQAPVPVFYDKGKRKTDHREALRIASSSRFNLKPNPDAWIDGIDRLAEMSENRDVPLKYRAEAKRKLYYVARDSEALKAHINAIYKRRAEMRKALSPKRYPKDVWPFYVRNQAWNWGGLLQKPIYHYFPFRRSPLSTTRRARVDFKTTKGKKYFVYYDPTKGKKYVMGRVKSYNAKNPDDKIMSVVYE